jgi:hypothetical protein
MRQRRNEGAGASGQTTTLWLLEVPTCAETAWFRQDLNSGARTTPPRVKCWRHHAPETLCLSAPGASILAITESAPGLVWW